MAVSVAEIFHKRLSFEEAIRLRGTDIEAPARPYTSLRESIKLNSFVGNLEEISERARKQDEAIRRERDVRSVAAGRGWTARTALTVLIDGDGILVY